MYLDTLALMSEDAALIAYETTFFICAVASYIFVRFIKKQSFNVFRERDKILAALFETAGQYFYVFAMADRAVIAAPIIASYCALSVIWSRLFLKEKLSGKQYATIGLVFAGILLLGVAEGLAE
jgi:drug/metabolite transporter (DMT)-like permease